LISLDEQNEQMMNNESQDERCEQNEQNEQLTEDYRNLRHQIVEWLPSIGHIWFESEKVDRQFNIRTGIGKHNRWTILERLVKRNELEKKNDKYRVIEKSLDYINWWDADANDTLDIKFPRGKDGTGFGFDGDILIYPQDLIVVAGESNKGKTSFALNFVIENMDDHKVRLMGNEYEAHKFAARMRAFNWVNLFDDDLKPKFELIKRFDNHKDIIEPDSVNVIDWINLKDNFYLIGDILEGIKAKLNRGIALVVLQKDEGKNLGRGGSFSKDLSSIYLSISSGLLRAEKIKSSKSGMGYDGKTYKFLLTDAGSRFTHINEVLMCRACNGKGEYYGGKECIKCNGVGYTNVE
jgi:hypothetical protein